MPAKIASIFLSATARDGETYRQALKSAIELSLRQAKIALQEDWAAKGAQFVHDACRDELLAKDGYIGLFGHRYGWVPPGFTESITQLEFGWATQRWRDEREPPLFVLLPVEGSEADDALDAAAENVLKQEFPRDKSRRQRSRAEQQAFIRTVRAWFANRVLTFYGTQRELELKGAACIQNWNLALFERAQQGPRRAGGEVAPDELGRIGRTPQIDAARRVVRAVRKSATHRGAIFAVHGPANHGQWQFAALLASGELFDDCETASSQARDPDDPLALARWACDALQQPWVAGDEIASLAALLNERLAHTEVVLVLRAFGQAPDRWQRLEQGLWRPLLAAMAQRSATAARHRLFWFVVDHAPCACDDAQTFWTEGLDAAAMPRLDPTRVLPLPALGTLTAEDVEQWLEEIGARHIVDLPRTRREAIAAAATTPDGVPALVYDRLPALNFWP